MSRSSVSVCAWPRAWRSLSARGWAGLAAGLILLSMPCARAEPGTASTDAPAYAPAYAPTYAPPAIAARYPDRLGLSLRISTLSLVAAQSGGEHVNTVSGFGGVLRYRFRPWLAGELSADLLGGDSGALHRTSVPFVASIIAELRPWGVVSPFVSAGLGVLWNRHQRSAAAGGDSFSDQQGLAQIGAGVRIRLWRGLNATLELRGSFSGRDADTCTASVCPRSAGDTFGVQLIGGLGWYL